MSNGYLVAIDNGHGSNTSGKRTPVFTSGPLQGSIMHEWEFNYAVARRLNDHLIRCGFETILVSNTSTDTPLSVRAQKAIDHNANLFVSIHANAMGSGNWATDQPMGIETLYSYLGNSKAVQLASTMQTYLSNFTQRTYSGATPRGIKSQDLGVLNPLARAGIPAILTENGFMDSTYDAMYLIDNNYRDVIAVAHAKAICKFMNVAYIYPPNGPTPEM